MSQTEQMAMGSRGFQYMMSAYNSSDNVEHSNFDYDSEGRLIAHYYEYTGSYAVIDSIRYNEQSQIVRLDGYQLLNDQWKHVYYLEYTYDNAGNINSRSNYNFMSDEWMLGGIYEYTYNDNHQILTAELTMGGSIFQTVDYEYENGRLANVIWSIADWGGSLQYDEKLTYYYNANGQVETIQDSLYSSGWEASGYEGFVYDDNGNCTEHTSYNDLGNPTDRSIFEYDNRLLSQTLVPVHPEIERPAYFSYVNIYNVEHWYTLDANYVFQYVCDFIYEYSAASTVEEHVINSVSCFPNPANNMITIAGEENSNVTVFDMSGRLVMQGILDGNQLNVSNLYPGTYLMQIKESTGTRTGRIVISR